MSDQPTAALPEVLQGIRNLAQPLRGSSDLRPLAESIGANRFVAIGEASHGNHEFYSLRAELTKQLIEEHGFTWIGVEGDWPDCWRINRWVRGDDNQNLDASQLLAGFERWPTWMWANSDVAAFIEWLRDRNLARPREERVGFYGLDVYSLWDSLRELILWLEANQPDAVGTAMTAWQCFVPYNEDPHRYAWGTRLIPASCEPDVVSLLVEIRKRAAVQRWSTDEGAFDAAQNAEVVAGAENYYRTMMLGDQRSWNVRDYHMADTIDRLAEHTGPSSKGVIWEHNTHVGDARATDMARDGLVNTGQILRERHGDEGVALVGFASHRGSVLAGAEWGSPERVMPVPLAAAGSHEDLLHQALGHDAVLLFGDDRSSSWLTHWRGHRAIGVVYNPDREHGNFVPTGMGARYDALIWIEEVTALRPLHHEPRPQEPEFETEPSGF